VVQLGERPSGGQSTGVIAQNFGLFFVIFLWRSFQKEHVSVQKKHELWSRAFSMNALCLQIGVRTYGALGLS